MVQARLESSAFVSPNALGAGSRTPAMTRHGRKAIGCVVASIDVPSLAERPRSAAGAAPGERWVRESLNAAPVCCSGWFGAITSRPYFTREILGERRALDALPAPFMARKREVVVRQDFEHVARGTAIKAVAAKDHDPRVADRGLHLLLVFAEERPVLPLQPERVGGHPYADETALLRSGQSIKGGAQGLGGDRAFRVEVPIGKVEDQHLP